MGRIADRLHLIKSTLPDGVTLVAVSKFHPVAAIMEAYEAGARDFGESRVQELSGKAPQLPGDIRWHFIGHLQTNKVRQLLPHATLIHSIDSVKLLEKVEAEAARASLTTDVLLQVHVAAEETKFGFSPEELAGALTPAFIQNLAHVRIRGVMGMASNTDDTARIADDFAALRRCFDTLRSGVFAGNDSFDTLSMGMSHDYEAALKSGSTMVRIGSDIFGAREY